MAATSHFPATFSVSNYDVDMSRNVNKDKEVTSLMGGLTQFEALSSLAVRFVTCLLSFHIHRLLNLRGNVTGCTTTNPTRFLLSFAAYFCVSRHMRPEFKTVPTNSRYLRAVTLAFTSANIIFPFVQPTCDYLENPGRCLNGQVCIENNTCIPLIGNDHRVEISIGPRPDGRCGRDFDGASCDPNAPYGPCCSQHGWCGKTPEHCLTSNGCQSGCRTPSKASPTTLLSQSTSTGALSEPIISPNTATSGVPTPTGPVTTDGTCGAANGGTICGDWHLGSCCSM